MDQCDCHLRLDWYIAWFILYILYISFFFKQISLQLLHPLQIAAIFLIMNDQLKAVFYACGDIITCINIVSNPNDNVKSGLAHIFIV